MSMNAPIMNYKYACPYESKLMVCSSLLVLSSKYIKIASLECWDQ